MSMDNKTLLTDIMHLRDQAITFASQHETIEGLDEEHRISAENLLHYLSVRKSDLREYQLALIEQGITSLGLLEAHTVATLNSVINILQCLEGQTPTPAPDAPVPITESCSILEQRTEALFGSPPENREVYIMVTMPAAAADDVSLIEGLLRAGMNIMRINCAHDDVDVWQKIIVNLRIAEQNTGKSCKTQLDLAGPKLRTGQIRFAGKVFKIKPERDIYGRVTKPGRLWLIPKGFESIDIDYLSMEVSGKALEKSRIGDEILLTDSRAAKRKCKIIASHYYGRLIETTQTIYLQEESTLNFVREGQAIGQCHPVNLHEMIKPILLHVGDELVLTRSDLPGEASEYGAKGQQKQKAHIHCTLEDAFSVVEAGQEVWLDDGKIGGVVKSNNGEEIDVLITHTPPGKAKLRAEKGINFPAADFNMPALTDKDIADLEIMVDKVDMVALSFVRTSDDVKQLQEHLQRLGTVDDTGIILKIENGKAFENLPAILLTAMQSPKTGVMIARGDLAVEVGFDRLSEVQEEILWLCEAAHMPVIWATQILENLAKKGAPSRAEVTDAAMSIRAECAMLNKGPNIVETVELLHGILQLMDGHYHKRRLMLGPLKVCTEYPVI